MKRLWKSLVLVLRSVHASWLWLVSLEPLDPFGFRPLADVRHL